MRKFLWSLVLLLTLISCKNDEKKKIDVSHIVTDTKVARFEVDFYNTSEETLPELKKKYPLFFPHNVDSVWINKINNTDEQELFKETQKIYSNFSPLEKQINSLFQHIKYYNPEFIEPLVVTTISNIDYNNRVLYTGDYLIISLDVYLGKDHEFYGDYPLYVKTNNTKEHIIVDVANAIVSKQIKPSVKRTFIEKMIAEGKKMYVLDMYLPNESDREKIGYAINKFAWIQANEEGVWRYFIEKDLLYSTDSKLNKRFLDIAPFSKFYLESDVETPGRVGVWIGWQIVRAFMKNNDVSLRELMQMNAEEIFKKSKYKPRK
ncbi:gliding motility lipoprotein GldB [uncultured Tenacibaculum sp.]|uniref:gliding motility lipoprotein GldB n=1 Tax=uncultured Tenacibaculum sp. TaxID=174713 RepID=UPI00262A6179|nr:gliding motility lipoprotein GldB [uncultured Tenacibaculum sp.]